VEQVRELKRKRELEAKVKRAKEREARGDWETAISTYEALISEYPNEPELKTRRENAQAQARMVKAEMADQLAAKGEWESAISIYEALSQESPDEEEWKTRLEIVREQSRQAQMERAEQFAAKEKFEEAVNIYETLLQESPDKEEYKARLENVQARARLAQRYNEAIGALKTGNLDAAQHLLAEVIGQQPDYKEASRYLLMTTDGVDIEELKMELERLKSELAAKQKELGKLKSELTAKKKQEIELEKLKSELAVKGMTSALDRRPAADKMSALEMMTMLREPAFKGLLREETRRLVQSMGAESLLKCPVCGENVKAGNMMRHFNKIHV